MEKIKILKNTLFWGFILWLIGWFLGVVLFMVVPANLIGWVITPIGIIITLWVLFKKIEREEFMCFFGVGLIWTIMAVVLDYIFNVKLFNIENYYKLDIYLYYAFTFIMPLLVGWYKIKLKPKK
jgi:hypothetical protein